MSKSLIVLVLGDLGRSPRMCNHAISIAEQTEFNVDLIGYGNSNLCSEIRKSGNIRTHFIPDFSFSAFPSPLALLLKLIFRFIFLFFYLIFAVPAAEYVIIQNPPSHPTMMAAKLYSLIMFSKVIVDWHNLGYTIMALKHKQKRNLLKKSSQQLIKKVTAKKSRKKRNKKNRKTLTRNLQKINKSKALSLHNDISDKNDIGIMAEIYKRFEYIFSKGNYANLCVSKAMAGHLKSEFNINANILYDCPNKRMCRSSIENTHNLFMKLKKLKEVDLKTHPKKLVKPEKTNEKTLLTKKINEKIELRRNRPFLFISSTSWTPDENFDIFFEAIWLLENKFEKLIAKKKIIRNRIHFIITGKGPLKSKYQKLVRKMKLKHIKIELLWLEYYKDYITLLGSADGGISLHQSSSGLDLPMKAIDMIGCELFTFALDFECISELIKEGQTGSVFKTPNELSDQIINYIKNGGIKVEKINLKWENEWKAVMTPLLL